MFGRRSDGKRIKNIDPVFKAIPHIMKERNDSQNLYVHPAKCEPLDIFIKEKKEENIHFNYMHIVIASIVRLIALRPQLNRFVMNGKHYKRKKIYVSFVMKKALRDSAAETTVKLEFKGTENIYEIKQMIDESIQKNNTLKTKNDTDRTAKIITSVPNFLIRFALNMLKWLDKHGMLPKKLIEVSPFHTTCFLTNLKSIKIDFIYHHLYNFGTTGIFISMGKEQLQPVVDNNGNIVVGKIMNLGVVTDERFCDGFYYAMSLRLLKRILENPSALEQNLEKINYDVD